MYFEIENNVNKLVKLIHNEQGECVLPDELAETVTDAMERFDEEAEKLWMVAYRSNVAAKALYDAVRDYKRSAEYLEEQEKEIIKYNENLAEGEVPKQVSDYYYESVKEAYLKIKALVENTLR